MAKLPICLLISGVVVTALALVFGFVAFPKILRSKINEQSMLVNGTTKWESWREVPVPVFLRLTLFNVTNPAEVKKGGKPNLVELGPYVYQHKRKKVDISLDEEKGTVAYRHHDDYFYRPEMSNGTLTDVVTILNLPFLGAAYKSIQAGGMVRYLVSEMVTDSFPDEDLYVTRTVDEVLFGGYFSPLIKELSEMKGEAVMPNNTFGLFYARNGTDSQQYVMSTGTKGIESYGQIYSYNGQSSLETFEEEKCDKVEGYDGPSIPPFLTRDRSFNLFIPSFCRPLPLAYEKDVEIDGIPAFKFSVPESALAEPLKNPENRCYCSEKDDQLEKCYKSGVWDLGPCKQGTPMVMSFPHFFQADPIYTEQSIGLKPEEEKHQMVVVFEPTASISLEVKMRVQMNMALSPSKHFSKLKKIPEMVHPIFWMEQGVTLPPQTRTMIKEKLIKSQEMVKTGTYVAIGVGVALILVALAVHFCRKNKEKEAYSPRKASVELGNGVGNNSLPTDSVKYYHVASPPTVRTPDPKETEPFLSQRAPGSKPLGVAVYPVVPPTPQVSFSSSNNPAGSDVVDGPPNAPQVNGIDNKNALGAPFPRQGEFSSTNSMNRDYRELDDTLKGINDALSSYENLKA